MHVHTRAASFSRGMPPLVYLILVGVINVVDNAKLLGTFTTIPHNLSWNKHTETIARKVGETSHNTLYQYKKPVLEYACPIFSKLLSIQHS